MTEQQHPLTDEIIREIIDEIAPDEWIFDWDYDLMCAAADWQLERLRSSMSMVNFVPIQSEENF